MLLEELLVSLHHRFEYDCKGVRIRQQYSNSLFIKEQYKKTLLELDFEDSASKIQIERGEIPVNNQLMSLLIRSQLDPAQKSETCDFLCDEGLTLA